MMKYKAAFFDTDGTLWHRSDNQYCFTSIMSSLEIKRGIESGLIVPTSGVRDFLQLLLLGNLRIVVVSENYWKVVTSIMEHPKFAIDRFFKENYDEKNEYDVMRIYLMPYNSMGCFTKAECVRHYLKSYNIAPGEAFFVDNEERDLKSLEEAIPELKTILMSSESKEKRADRVTSFDELIQRFSKHIY